MQIGQGLSKTTRLLAQQPTCESLMDLDSLKTTVIDFVREHQAWAPFIVAVLAFCESLAMLSILVPATFLLLALGVFFGASDIPFWPIWLGAAVGAILGDFVSYEFGRYFKDSAKQIWPLNRHPDLVARGEDFTKRYGALGVFGGKFVGPARAVVPLIAGIFAMPRFYFQLANVSSGLVWSFAMLAPGSGLATLSGWWSGW